MNRDHRCPDMVVADSCLIGSDDEDDHNGGAEDGEVNEVDEMEEESQHGHQRGQDSSDGVEVVGEQLSTTSHFLRELAHMFARHNDND